MDVFSGFAWVYALPGGHSQVEAKACWDRWFSEHRPIGRLLTDRGAEFNSIAGVLRAKTSFYHPQGNGKLESFHLELANLSRVNAETPTVVVTKLRTAVQSGEADASDLQGCVGEVCLSAATS